MSKLFGMLSAGSGAVAAAGVCGVLIVAGVYVQQNRNAEAFVEAEPVVEDVTPVAVEPKVADVEPAVVEVEAAAVEAEKAAPEPLAAAPTVMTAAPAFDEVRREVDGMTVIAGRGAPGATVSVLQNGIEIANSRVDRSGKFATLAVIPLDGLGHSLTLSQETAQGAQKSEGEILLAPLAAPVEAVETPAEPATVPTDVVEATPEDQPQIANQIVAGTDAPTLTAPSEVAEDASVATDVAIAGLADSASQKLTSPTSVPTGPSAPTAVLRATAEGVELLNPETPDVMDNVALDTISYSDKGEVQLAGRAQSDASTVRVYLDNNAKVDLPVDADGRWRGDVPDVDQGIYTLRVDEVAADGKVSSRVETPFKREDPQVLAAAVAAQENGPIKAITVQKGATLWAIARDRYGDGELYVRVFNANKNAIRDPDLIYPGQIFELPQ